MDGRVLYEKALGQNPAARRSPEIPLRIFQPFLGHKQVTEF
jgi:hypothetical protein